MLSVYNEFFLDSHEYYLNAKNKEAMETGLLRPLAPKERYLLWLTNRREAAGQSGEERMLDVWALVVTMGELPKTYAFNPQNPKDERLHEPSGLRYYYTQLGADGYAKLAEHFVTKGDHRKLSSEMMVATSRKHQVVNAMSHVSAWLDVTSICRIAEIERPAKRLVPDEDLY